MYWSELTAPALNKLAKKKQVTLILNIAATEQHGPALPVGTDSLIGDALIAATEAKLPSRLLVLPQLTVGCSDHHMSLGGTLTLTHDSFKNYVENLIDSIYQQGFRKFFILNSHGGNIAVMQLINEEMGYKYPDLKLASTSWWRVAHKQLTALSESGHLGTGHACEFETSLIAHILGKDFPKKSFGNFGLHPTAPEFSGDLLNSPPVNLYRTFKTMTKNGIYGDPTTASQKKGERIIAIVTKELVSILEKF